MFYLMTHSTHLVTVICRWTYGKVPLLQSKDVDLHFSSCDLMFLDVKNNSVTHRGYKF